MNKLQPARRLLLATLPVALIVAMAFPVSATAATVSDSYAIRGFEYFATRSWALGGSFKWTTGEFDRMRVDNATVTGLQMDATSARFNMGFTWYPMGR